MNILTRIVEHKIFRISLAIKGIHGAIEIVTGIILLSINNSTIIKMVQKIYGNELLEDPKDFFGNLFINAAQKFSVHWQVFFSLYMMVHGILNIAIALALTHKKLWIFPYAVALQILFIFYQIYQFFHGYSILMLAFTIIDIIILILLRHEHGNLKRKISSDKKAQ